MRKNMWPDGDTMTVQCPCCSAPNEVQIAVVREDDGPCRPAECDTCRVDFEVQPNGKVFLEAPTRKGKNLEFLKDLSPPSGAIFIAHGDDHKARKNNL